MLSLTTPTAAAARPCDAASNVGPASAALRALSAAELEERFRAGSRPDTVHGLDGDPAGLGLALAGRDGGWLDRRSRRFAASERFPWNGKSFRSTSHDQGWGFNRLARGPALAVLPFRTSIAASIVDGEPVIRLDFDIARNPRWQRATLDELREVMPGVFLGPTGIRLRGRYLRLAWFAIDTNQTVELVATGKGTS